MLLSGEMGGKPPVRLFDNGEAGQLAEAPHKAVGVKQLQVLKVGLLGSPLRCHAAQPAPRVCACRNIRRRRFALCTRASDLENLM
eukprot:9500663-Pyramimonas_sp.AAC.1